MQNSVSAEPSNHISIKDSDDGAEKWSVKSDLWKPLNCLVEVANRTKTCNLTIQGGSATKEEKIDDLDDEVHAHKTKVREHIRKPKVEDDKNDAILTHSGLTKARRMNGTRRKRATTNRELNSQAVLDDAGVKHMRRISPIWFSLVASDDQYGTVTIQKFIMNVCLFLCFVLILWYYGGSFDRKGDAPLPQISSCYLRIK